MSDVEPVQILLVEDSSDDILLTRKALLRARIANELHVVTDGEEAMRFLRGESDASAPRPDLVLLDLNLPGMDGREVLEEIKGDPALRQIPVIALTTSAEERDVVRAYDAHVNAYVTKPLSFDQFIDAVRSIESFWLRLVKFPSNAVAR